MKILYHGDSPMATTGFGTVSKNLLKYLAKDNEITVIGINDRGGWKDPKEYPYKIYPAIYDNYHDLLGITRLFATLEGNDPEIKEKEFDVLILQYDMFLIAEMKIGNYSMIDALKTAKERGRIKKAIIYTPIDNSLIREEWAKVAEFFDYIVVPSQYGKRILEGKFGAKWVKEKVRVIPYGVETDIFKPLPDEMRQKIRQTITTSSEGKVDLTDKYIIGFVGRNQWRKDLYHLIEIYSNFKKRRKNAYLYIHTDPNDLNHDGGNVMQLFYDFGLLFGRDYFMPLGLRPEAGLSRQDLNEVYNMMDVYLSCSMAEGFGLPYVEAMLAGVPVIAPNNTTVPELLGNGRGFIYPNKNTICFGQIDFMRVRELADPEAGLEFLDIAYHRKQAGQQAEMIEKARVFALSCTTHIMAENFKKLL